ncbi:MAG: AEC family transporter [Myxococcota bacterium]
MPGELAAVIAPTIVCAALGWAWGRWGPHYDRDLITALIANLGAPCLVFSRLTALEVEAAALAQIAVAAVLALISFAAIGAIALRVWGLPAHTFLAPLIFGNAGNLGMSLCLFAFGSQGLALAVCFYAVMATVHFTFGILIWSGRLSPAELLRSPLSAAALLAVLVIAAELPVPLWIRNTTGLLGGITIPLMLLTLGVSIGELKVARLGRTIALSLLRLGMGVLVGIALADLLGFEGISRGVLILECSMPAAVFNYLLAQRYGRSPDQVASIVVVSTLIALLLLPALLAYVL